MKLRTLHLEKLLREKLSKLKPKNKVLNIPHDFLVVLDTCDLDEMDAIADAIQETSQAQFIRDLKEV